MRYLPLLLLSVLSTCARAQELYFPPTTNGNWERMSLEEAGLCTDGEEDFRAYLEQTNTDAFLLLKDGKIVMEYYFGDFTASSPHVWNSAGKSLMAMAVGIAADLDSLDIQDRTVDYLGSGWTDCPETESDIRIVHQLTMTSGLSDLTGDPYCTDPDCLVCEAAPGQRWAYYNAPYTLLGRVIEEATGEELNDFVRERIRQPTGMAGQFVPLGYNRVFVSNARSMARYGLLVLAGGCWNGEPILQDTAYFNAMVTSSQSINPAYGYLWWLNGKETFRLPSSQMDFPGPIVPAAPADAYAAIGANAQIITVVPSRNLVMVRMGDDPEDGPVSTIFLNRVWERLNALECTTTTSPTPPGGTTLSVYPNPATNRLTLEATAGLQRVDIYASRARHLGTLPLNGTRQTIPLNDLPTGILWFRVTTRDGERRWRRVVHGK